MRGDQAVLVGTLIGCGALSAWLLPDGWRLASLPVALVCATAAKRLAGGQRVQEEQEREGRGE